MFLKSCFVNNKTRTSQATSNTSISKFNDNIPQWSESSSSEEENIGISKRRRESNVEMIHEVVKGSSSDVEEIKIRKCRREIHVDIIK